MQLNSCTFCRCLSTDNKGRATGEIDLVRTWYICAWVNPYWLCHCYARRHMCACVWSTLNFALTILGYSIHAENSYENLTFIYWCFLFSKCPSIHSSVVGFLAFWSQTCLSAYIVGVLFTLVWSGNFRTSMVTQPGMGQLLLILLAVGCGLDFAELCTCKVVTCGKVVATFLASVANHEISGSLIP